MRQENMSRTLYWWLQRKVNEEVLNNEIELFVKVVLVENIYRLKMIAMINRLIKAELYVPGPSTRPALAHYQSPTFDRPTNKQ